MMIENDIDNLNRIAESEEKIDIINFFKTENNRVDEFSIDTKEIFLDFSKNHFSNKTLQELIGFGNNLGFQNKVLQMFEGKEVNSTEKRKVLHFLLRNHSNDQFNHLSNEKEIIKKQLAELESLVNDLKDKRTAKRPASAFKNIIVVGIGGSHLGPELVSEALINYHQKPFNMQFLVNADHTEFDLKTGRLDARKTLIVVISKSMTTAETILNLKALKEWLISQGVDKSKIGNHFVIVSGQNAEHDEIDFKPFRRLRFEEWVGGRFSLWSSAGLPIALQIGFKNFERLLAGAAAVDEAFLNVDIQRNIPKILALIAFWNNNCMNKPSYAVIPYDTRLKLLPQYLQQLEMESNGKSVGIDGKMLRQHSAPLTWGGIGTSSQHAVFQFLHQSTYKVPIDFIMTLESPESHSELHRNQVANCIAQSEALMVGNKNNIDKTTEPYKLISGNVPSNTIILKKLTPYSLGSLLAIYEHKNFFLSTILSINAFDQWGVEKGKLLAKTIETDLKRKRMSPHDPSTEKLLSLFLKHNED